MRDQFSLIKASTQLIAEKKKGPQTYGSGFVHSMLDIYNLQKRKIRTRSMRCEVT